jgi:excisionase family DNA binding protein
MLTVKEVAKRLGVSASQVYTLCASGRLLHHRFGVRRGAIRVTEEQLAAFIEATKFKPPAELPALVHIQLHGAPRPEDASASR